MEQNVQLNTQNVELHVEHTPMYVSHLEEVLQQRKQHELGTSVTTDLKLRQL